MSLRIFHVVFIVVCVGFSIFVGVWGFQEYSATRSVGALALAIVFLGAAGALILYGKKAFGKLRELD
ncbi:MAG TPA: hypothetical protein VFL80_12265 [Thermoanaerobaculia bacterium]|nr:hypothetical protein [Thermoanaerobaculia bacterium]